MKRMFKKTLALILALTLVFGAAPLAGLVGLELPSLKDVFADKAEAATYGVLSYKRIDGEVTITGCDKLASGALEIPATIEGFPVTSIGVQVFSGCSGLTSVIIPKSVTSIGGYAFEACSSLTSVYYTGDITGWCAICFDNSDSNPLCKAENFYIDGKKVEGDFVIPDSVTSIGNYAFYKCTGLTGVTIPDSVTSIGNYAFAWCDSLTNITIPDNVTNIGSGAFCGTIIYKDSSNWENNVLYIENYLIEAKSDLSGSCSIKENTIAIADKAFSGCSGLTSIIIPNSVTSIGDYAFYCCTGLTSIIIPNSVTSIGDFSFYCCTGLTSVTIGNSVTSIGDYAFKWCDSLTNITIPDSVTSIGDYAFYNCASLTSVTIPNSVMSIGDGAFTYCKKLITITVDGSNQYYSSDENGALFNKDKTELIQYPAGRTATEYTIPDSVTSLGNYAFQSCTGLTSVIIPDSVTSIGNYAFSSCTGLTSVTIPNSVMSIGEYAFYNCASLTSVTIPSSVTMINSFAFAYCSGLTSATIPNSVIFIGDYVFQACPNLTDVYYSGTEAEWGTIIIQSGNDKLLNANIHFCICGDNAFWMFDDTTGRLIINGTGTMNDWIIWMYTPWHNYCSDIKSVIINSGITSIGDFAFSNCTELTSVAIPDSVMNIGDYAFYHCTGLTSITVDENNQYYSSDETGVLFNKVKTELIQYPIGRTATEYTIPDSVTSIGENSFVGCESLSSVTIGNSVTSIGDYAFLGCTRLTSITVDENNQYYSSDENGVLFNKVKTELIQYPIGRTATEYTIPDSVTSIGESSFVGCENLLSVTIGNSVTSIGYSAFSGCTALADVYYDSTEEEWNAITIGEKNENLTNAKIHFQMSPGANIYNLGEETYSFDNFGDSDAGGHCFGMAVTSSGYYTGELDISAVGGNDDRSLYSLSKTATVTAPICYYHKIQGNYVEKNSIVAGGNIDLHNRTEIKSDWNACVNYVKDHSYDNKGILNIGMWYAVGGGHAVNFLYYKEVNGQQRIYAYDNNFPEIETYFYMDSNGYVRQAPQQTLNSNIIGFDLMDTEKYFSLAPSFDFKRYIYADENEIKVEGTKMYYLKSNSGLSSYVMFEIPEDVTEVSITPLTKNASFEYNNESYSFGAIDNKTCGILTVLTKESSGQRTEFEIVNAPDNNCSASIATPSTTTISYGDSIILHADINGTLPAGARVEWTASNGNFDMSVSADGTTCKISPKSSGKTVFTATVYDKDGNVISSDTQEMSAKAGFFDKIVAFFKKIFGLTKTIPEAFKNIF